MADNRDRPRPGDDTDGVSWRMIAAGMPVVASDGTQVGRVTHALGDPDRDIFDGVGFRHHLWSSPRMAPAGLVGRITESAVHLTITNFENQCRTGRRDLIQTVGAVDHERHRLGGD